jgi:HSP20 family molecular chaperone IbpA
MLWEEGVSVREEDGGEEVEAERERERKEEGKKQKETERRSNSIRRFAFLSLSVCMHA